jgi:FKBP-type peptidyl-prolyl cis-trans isomerase
MILMKRLFKQSLSIFVILSLFSSCAKEESESTDNIEQRYIESHVKVIYKDTLTKTSSGLYIINLKEGTGPAITDTSGVYVRYSVMDFRNNYSATTYDSIAKIIGTYSDTTYFGPRLFQMGDYSLMRGVEEALKLVKQGGRIKFIIPTWLSNYNYKGSAYLLSSPYVYDIEVLRVVPSVAKFQIDTLEAYSKKYYGGIDSIAYGFYHKSLEEGIGDTLAVDEYVSFWYVARLLDGFVVDTNIEDTARKYRIYNSSVSYTALSHTIVDIDKTTDNELIPAIDKALLNMKHGGVSVVFFSSSWGYGSSSKGFGRYQPMVYWIKVVSDDNDDSDD